MAGRIILGNILILFLLACFSCKNDSTTPPEPEYFGFSMARLTTDGGTKPVWSPDGERIAYVNKNEIWMISASGGDPSKLTDMRGVKSDPYWHADQSNPTLVFVNKDMSEYSIITLNLDSMEFKEIYKTDAIIGYPSFTPDGSRIVFSGTDRGYGIRSVSALGDSEAVQIPNSEGWGFPVSSRCSRVEDKIVYINPLYLGSDVTVVPSVCVISLQGGDPTSLADGDTEEIPHPWRFISADWSKDGSRIVFSHSGVLFPSDIINKAAVYTIDSDGANIRPWSKDYDFDDFSSISTARNSSAALYYYPSFSPDGKKVVCHHDGNLWILTLED